MNGSQEHQIRSILFPVLLTLFTNVALFANVACGDEPIVPPQGGQHLLNFREDGSVQFRRENIEATAGWVPIEGMPFDTAYQVEADVRFSNPNFVSIVHWGFWEKAHWKPAAALWQADWSLKPSGKVFVDLVTNQWWTDETVTTTPAGTYHVRGFLGYYEVSVEHDGQTVKKKTTLDRDGTKSRIQLAK